MCWLMGKLSKLELFKIKNIINSTWRQNFGAQCNS